MGGIVGSKQGRLRRRRGRQVEGSGGRRWAAAGPAGPLQTLPLFERVSVSREFSQKWDWSRSSTCRALMRESSAGMDFERGVTNAVERLAVRQPFSDSPPHAHQHPSHRFCRPRFPLKCCVLGPTGTFAHPAPARAGASSPYMIVECGLAGLYP